MASLIEERAGAYAGILALTCYFGAAFIPLPDAIGRLLGFGFGPLFIISFLGIRAAIERDADGMTLRIGVLFGVIAGAIVTTLLAIQMGNQMWLEQEVMHSDPDEVVTAQIIWQAINRVQALMDVSWDVFLSSGAVLIGISMIRSASFGPLWGGLGILIGSLLLALNLFTFPRGPAYVGYIDLGPLLAVWFGAVYIRILLTHREGRLRM
jgi:hypothetical protein